MRRSFHIRTYGCQMNALDSQKVAALLCGAGYSAVDELDDADLLIVNTCSIRDKAEQRLYADLGQLRAWKRERPGRVVGVAGCVAQQEGDALLRRFAAVDFVYGTHNLRLVPSLAAAAERGERSLRIEESRSLDRFDVPQLHPDLPRETPGRAFVTVMEGCDMFCTFCIVPRTRGRERSLEPAAVAAVVREREEEGAQEVVITGTQLGAYGRDRDARNYGPAAVIRAVLAETAVPRVRFSSLQPQDITPELLALWEDPRLCRHFHLALQSGSETVLRRMRRRYSKQQYTEAQAAIRAAVPDVAITTDVLVGFPEETDAEHEESITFCREAEFALMHVFPYSRRPGTTAHLLPGHVTPQAKRRRLGEMLAVAEESAAAFRRRFLGRIVPVLWEEESAADASGVRRWNGLTDTYVRVETLSARDLRNRLTPVRLVAEAGESLRGELVTTAAGGE